MVTTVYLMNCTMLQNNADLYARCCALCPEARRNKIDRLVRASDRAASLGAYMLLVWGLRKLLGVSDIPEVYVKESGKPCIDREGLHFNLSHSGCYAACGFSASPIGVDIERGIKGMSRQSVRLWGCREAYGKYTERGITERFDVEDFAHIDSDGCYVYKGKYLYSKTMDEYVLSVYSACRQVVLTEISEAELYRFLRKEEGNTSESTAIR